MTIDDDAVPLPTAELMRRAAELSPKQREVLDALDSFPEGALLSELSKELGIHVNTVRGHVDELAERGLVGWRVASPPPVVAPRTCTTRAPRSVTL